MSPRKESDLLRQGALELLAPRPPKVYELTRAGRRRLAAEGETWECFSGAVEAIPRGA